MDWPGTLGRILERVEGQVVPGHGGVVGRELVEEQMSQLTALADLARWVRFEGGTVEDAIPDAPFEGAVRRTALERAFAQLGGAI
jgi:hypothetical protein